MAIKGGISTDYRGTLQGATYMFAGLNNIIDPYNLPLDKGWLPKADNVDIDNTNSISRREGYVSRLTTTASHSGWSDGKLAYFIDDVYLKSFDGSTTKVIDIVTPNLKMYFKQVNNVIAYSNGIESGIIGDLSNTDPKTYSSYFKEGMFVGTHLEFYNGRLYYVKDNALYCTDTFDIQHSDLRYKDVLAVASKITMVRRVEDGLYVGSEKQTHFLRGNDPVEGGFELEIVADYGVIDGSDSVVSGEYIPDAKSLGETVIWASTRGICTGAAGGNFKNHSIANVSIPEASKAASAIVDKGGFRQYIVTLDRTDEYNRYPDNTFDVNVI